METFVCPTCRTTAEFPRWGVYSECLDCYDQRYGPACTCLGDECYCEERDEARYAEDY